MITINGISLRDYIMYEIPKLNDKERIIKMQKAKKDCQEICLTCKRATKNFLEHSFSICKWYIVDKHTDKLLCWLPKQEIQNE